MKQLTTKSKKFLPTVDSFGDEVVPPARVAPEGGLVNTYFRQLEESKKNDKYDITKA